MAEALGALIISAIAEEGATALTVGGLTISAGTVGSTALLLGSIGLSYALAGGAPKQPTPADGHLSIKQPNPVRQGGYGRDRVAGAYMLYETNGADISTDVLALIGGQICGVRKFYLNEDPITLSSVRGGGFVTADGTTDGRYSANVNLDWRVGLPTEVAYSSAVSLVPSIWTTAHRGDGIASLYLQCRQAPSINDQPRIFPNGLPSASVVADLYPLWDPRDTNQDPDDPETWIAYPTYDATTVYADGDRVIFGGESNAPAYDAGTTYARYNCVSQDGVDYYSRVSGNIGHTPGSDLTKWLPIGTPYVSRANANTGNTPDQYPAFWTTPLANPVLQIIDQLADADHGMQLDRGLLITPRLDGLMTEADLCDELVVDKNGNLIPRYSSNGKFNFDADPADVLGGILASCDGWMTEDGDGALTLKVGVYRAPTVSFAPQHVLGFSIDYGIADEAVVNELALTFSDPDSGYKEVPGQPWRDETDISTRGRVRSQPLALSWVQRHAQARRLAKRAMARLLAPHGSLTLTLYGLLGRGQRWVNLDYPFLPQMANAVVELSEGSIDLTAGTVTFDWMLVDPATIDAWDPATEEGDGPALTAPGLPPALDFSRFDNGISYSFA